MGKLKDKLMEQFNSSPLNIGELIDVDDSALYVKEPYRIRDKRITARVISVSDDKVNVACNSYGYEVPISAVHRRIDKIGVNPLPEYSWHDDMHEVGYTTQWVYQFKGITFELNDGTKINGLNFNPYITDKSGKKVYYQRDLCWSLEDKQNFLESMYNELNCGAIVIKYNDDNKMKECLAEFDVVDGKQRLHTLIEFFNDEFADKNGYYWSDFSRFAQRKFLSSKCLLFYEMRENVSDEKVKKAFLNVNFTGVPMSKEHIEYVKSINV